MNKLDNFTPEQWILWIADYGLRQANKDKLVRQNLTTDSTSLSFVTDSTIKNEELITLKCPELLEVRVDEVVRISSKIFTQHFDKIDIENLKKWQFAFHYVKKDYFLNQASLKKLERIQQGLTDLIADRTKTIEGLNKYRVLKNCMKKLQSLTSRELAVFSEHLTSQMNQTVENIFKLRELEVAKIQQMKNNLNLLSADLSQYENSRFKAFQDKNFVSKFKGTIHELTEEYQKLSNQIQLLEAHRHRSESLVMQNEFDLIKSSMAKIGVKLPFYNQLEAFVVFFSEKIASNKIQKDSIVDVQTKLLEYFQIFRETQLNANWVALYFEDCQVLIDMILFLDDLYSELTSAELTPQFKEKIQSRLDRLHSTEEMYNRDLSRVTAEGPDALMHRDIMTSAREHKEMTKLKDRWDELKDILKDKDLKQFNDQNLQFTRTLVNFIEGATTALQCRESINKLVHIKLTSEESETLIKQIKWCDSSYVYKLVNCLNNFEKLVPSIDPLLANINIWNEASIYLKDSQRICRELKESLSSRSAEFDSQQKKSAYINKVNEQIDTINKKSTSYIGIFDVVINHINHVSKYNLTIADKQNLSETYRKFIQGKCSLDDFNQFTHSQNTQFQLIHHKEEMDALIQTLHKFVPKFSSQFRGAIANFQLMSRNAFTGDPSTKTAELAEASDRVKEILSWLEDNKLGRDIYKFENVVLQRLNNSIDRDTFISKFRTILKTNQATHVDLLNLGNKRVELQNVLGVAKMTTYFKDLSLVYKSWCLRNHPDKIGADKSLEKEKNEKSKEVNALFAEIKQICSDLPEDFKF